MKAMKRHDLHCHTTYSDGKLSPETPSREKDSIEEDEKSNEVEDDDNFYNQIVKEVHEIPNY
ncbi:MAG: hypothetical protein ACXAC7_16745 [Candidatus Hodarchaeales archaeon]|jgi:histidinol phosphatase-like PHP family hydrolase